MLGNIITNNNPRYQQQQQQKLPLCLPIPQISQFLIFEKAILSQLK